MRLSVRISPGAKKTAITKWQDDVLSLRIHAPPIDGRANEELIRFLADIFDVAPTQLAIMMGHTYKQKVIDVPLDQRIVEQKIQEFMAMMK